MTSIGGQVVRLFHSASTESLGRLILRDLLQVTVATSAFAEATNEAVNDDENAAGGLAPSVLIGVATTLGFSVLGAYITL